MLQLLTVCDFPVGSRAAPTHVDISTSPFKLQSGFADSGFGFQSFLGMRIIDKGYALLTPFNFCNSLKKMLLIWF